MDKEINKVKRIVLKDSKDELVFEKKGDLWLLDGHKEFLVKQNRISNLLSTIVQASIYEKKSDKIESLGKFGLLPIDDKNSTAVKIVLEDDNKKEIASMDVGKYDVELGRGAMGAYVRLDDNFQIWLIKASFVDLNLDYNGWVYSDMWNLQFGRFALIDGKPEVEKLVDLMSVMLNTKVRPANKSNSSNSCFTLNLSGENFKNLELTFYKEKDVFLVKYKFDENIKTEILKEFAKITDADFYEISKEDMEKIKNAVKSR